MRTYHGAGVSSELLRVLTLAIDITLHGMGIFFENAKIKYRFFKSLCLVHFLLAEDPSEIWTLSGLATLRLLYHSR